METKGQGIRMCKMTTSENKEEINQKKREKGKGMNANLKRKLVRSGEKRRIKVGDDWGYNYGKKGIQVNDGTAKVCVISRL